MYACGPPTNSWHSKHTKNQSPEKTLAKVPATHSNIVGALCRITDPINPASVMCLHLLVLNDAISVNCHDSNGYLVGFLLSLYETTALEDSYLFKLQSDFLTLVLNKTNG